MRGGERPTESHNLMRADRTRGMGRRAAERYAIPLSARAHRELHAAGDEKGWLAAYGVDSRALAALLWRCTWNYELGMRAVERARMR
jgi:hypothetical protein